MFHSILYGLSLTLIGLVGRSDGRLMDCVFGIGRLGILISRLTGLMSSIEYKTIKILLLNVLSSELKVLLLRLFSMTSKCPLFTEGKALSSKIDLTVRIPRLSIFTRPKLLEWPLELLTSYDVECKRRSRIFSRASICFVNFCLASTITVGFSKAFCKSLTRASTTFIATLVLFFDIIFLL
ncbi:hypothetical protein AGLY_007532 [Aphis glycines]|uniref:Uncharacterized protein n=1 Tax=Aphis glycines TaxID=307491 RepID=A0A6G0TMQ9_APHGL|nr:hypothetical protein AGLY_007532 [Aphis glycines]